MIREPSKPEGGGLFCSGLNFILPARPAPKSLLGLTTLWLTSTAALCCAGHPHWPPACAASFKRASRRGLFFFFRSKNPPRELNCSDVMWTGHLVWASGLKTQGGEPHGGLKSQKSAFFPIWLRRLGPLEKGSVFFFFLGAGFNVAFFFSIYFFALGIPLRVERPGCTGSWLSAIVSSVALF